jgi:hypothetical protein
LKYFTLSWTIISTISFSEIVELIAPLMLFRTESSSTTLRRRLFSSRKEAMSAGEVSVGMTADVGELATLTDRHARNISSIENRLA